MSTIPCLFWLVAIGECDI